MERGHSCPMPLGFDPHHPGGMAENSPTFQRWGHEFRRAQVPKGRLKPCAIRQPSLRDLSCRGHWFPTLKRWAIFACPSGTMNWPGFARLLWEQFLAALDVNVRSPATAGCFAEVSNRSKPCLPSGGAADRQHARRLCQPPSSAIRLGNPPQTL